MVLKQNKIALAVVVGVLFLTASHSPAPGAPFPTRMIKLIVTAGAGGGEDMEARALAPFLEKYLGQRIIIEDQPGAGGRIAMEKFQKTTPDG